MKIEIVSHPSGDQLPMLVDSDGLPIPSPNEFILSRRSLGTNTLTRNLRELSVFFLWLEENKIDLRAKIKSNRTFTEAEVVGGMVEALRRGQDRGKKVRKLSVSPHTFNQRLTTLRQYLAWYFDVEIGSIPTTGEQYERLRNHKNLVDDRLSQCFKNSPPENTGNSKGLSSQESVFLVNCLDPTNPDAFGRNAAVRYRNYVATLIMLLYGLRPGELLCLKVEDIEFGAISNLRVIRRPPDPQDERRPRPQIKRNGRVLIIDQPVFAQRINEYIMIYREQLAEKSKYESDYLLLSDEGDPLSQSTLTLFYKRLRAKYPKQCPPQLTAKALRHTFSSAIEKELRNGGMEEENRMQALAYLRGDSSLDSQSVYIAQEIEEQVGRHLQNYQRALFLEDMPW